MNCNYIINKKIKLIIFFIILFTTQLSAFHPGTYVCRNSYLIFFLTSNYKSKLLLGNILTKGIWEERGNVARIKTNYETEFFILGVGGNYFLSNSRGTDLGICIKKNEDKVKYTPNFGNSDSLATPSKKKLFAETFEEKLLESYKEYAKFLIKKIYISPLNPEVINYILVVVTAEGRLGEKQIISIVKEKEKMMGIAPSVMKAVQKINYDNPNVKATRIQIIRTYGSLDKTIEDFVLEIAEKNAVILSEDEIIHMVQEYNGMHGIY